jgi:uncharacterized low-complexity protein
VVGEAIAAGLCSEHFSVDGTLIESFASAKSFQPKAAKGDKPTDGNGFQPRNAEVDFHVQKRSNDTHASRTDAEAKLHRKGPGKEATLSHRGHTLTENRHGLIVTVTVTEANGTAERKAALEMLDKLQATHKVKPKTLGADKGYDIGEFYQELEERCIEPHVPLVKEPCDPKAVAHPKRKPGIEARQRMKARMTSEGYRTESEVSQENRRRLWLVEGNCGTGPESGGESLETETVVGNGNCGVQPGANAKAEAGIRTAAGQVEPTQDESEAI